MFDPVTLLQELVSIPAPPGQEGLLIRVIRDKVSALGLTSEVDAKGNVWVRLGPQDERTPIVITAHMDELGLMVSRVEPDGSLAVTPLGGVDPWKWGEGPVEILCREPLPGILSFGSVHTEDPSSVAVQARGGELTWDHSHVLTGLEPEDLEAHGVRPGTRVAMARSRRTLTKLGDWVSGYFLDDRADLVAWFLILEQLKDVEVDHPLLFVASASEEVGGEGALYLLNQVRPAICVALELGPIVPDTPAEICDIPTVWAKDSFAAMDSRDLDLIGELGLDVQWQVLSRGGSDASCAASHGLCARPVTFGIPMENSHGYEIIDPGAMESLAELTVAYLQAVTKSL